MNARLLAEFEQVEDLEQAMQSLRASDHDLLDAFAPFAIEPAASILGSPGPAVRLTMLLCGVCAAAAAYGIEAYSSILAYPLNSGGRPLNSWPVFLLVPFEFGIFAAALGGVIAFFRACDLPRLHDPLFDVPGFERASQDRLFLLARPSPSPEGESDLRQLLQACGARVAIRVVDS